MLKKYQKCWNYTSTVYDTKYERNKYIKNYMFIHVLNNFSFFINNRYTATSLVNTGYSCSIVILGVFVYRVRQAKVLLSSDNKSRAI